MLFPRYSIGDVPYWYQVRMGWTKEIPLSPMMRQYSLIFGRVAKSIADMSIVANKIARDILIKRLRDDLRFRAEVLENDGT